MIRVIGVRLSRRASPADERQTAVLRPVSGAVAASCASWLSSRKVVAANGRSEMKHRGSRHEDRRDPHHTTGIDVCGSGGRTERERRRIEENAAGDEWAGVSHSGAEADLDHAHRGQPTARDARLPRYSPPAHHRTCEVSDADETEGPSRLVRGIASTSKRAEATAREPVGGGAAGPSTRLRAHDGSTGTRPRERPWSWWWTADDDVLSERRVEAIAQNRCRTGASLSWKAI